MRQWQHFNAILFIVPRLMSINVKKNKLIKLINVSTVQGRWKKRKRPFYPYIFCFSLLRTWRISLPLVADDALKEIKGNKVAFQDCFIEDYLFLLTFPFLTIPEIPGFLPVTSPRGSQLIADWNSCFPSGVVLVADMETFQTNDSFRTWTRIRVPPNILTDDERHNVSDVNLYWSGIFFLINGIVYFRNLTAFTRLGNNENLPEGGIIGLSSRKWCWSKYKLKVSKILHVCILHLHT